MTTLCPKCEGQSNDPEVCNLCGALISRIVERPREKQFSGKVLDTTDQDAADITTPHSNRFTLLMLGVFAIGLCLFLARGAFIPQQTESGNVQEMSPLLFDSLVVQDSPEDTWVIDFWAPWCGPCRNFSPEFEAAAKQMGTKVNFAKVNIDEAKAIADRYGVQSIPRVVIIRGGKEISQAGGLPRKDLVEWVTRNL